MEPSQGDIGDNRPLRLPVDLPSSFLPELISGDRIEDFNAALTRIEGAEKEASREIRKAEEVYGMN